MRCEEKNVTRLIYKTVVHSIKMAKLFVLSYCELDIFFGEFRVEKKLLNYFLLMHWSLKEESGCQIAKNMYKFLSIDFHEKGFSKIATCIPE